MVDEYRSGLTLVQRRKLLHELRAGAGGVVDPPAREIWEGLVLARSLGRSGACALGVAYWSRRRVFARACS